MNYQKELFKNYHATRSVQLDPSDKEKLAWFDTYYNALYAPHFALVKKNARILELGCNKGYLLATLRNKQFTNLTGIDLSPDDLAVAHTIAPDVNLIEGDAFEYLEKNPDTHDVIILKALIEHIQKDRILPFLHLINKSLRAGGMVLIDVQNSDWLFGLHDRYVDFTHEVGFTVESLRQIMMTVFNKTNVTAVESPLWGMRWHARVRHRVMKKCAVKMLSWIEPEAPSWDKRLLIGIGKK